MRIYIDNNVWDFLLARNLDLAAELPRPEFDVLITREGEFEIPNGAGKAQIRDFIVQTIARCQVETDVLFGFRDESLPAEEQRMGGFGTARFAELKEVEFVAAQNAAPRSRKKKPKTKLHSHEADISLAARSLHSVVLTLDETGPLKAARAQGGKVVLLKNFDRSGMSLRKFVETELGDA